MKTHKRYERFCMKARSMTYRDEADDISNLWQISIHNISSLFQRRKHKRIVEPYKKPFMNCKRKNNEMKKRNIKNVAIAWDARRLIVKSGQVCWKQKQQTPFVRKNQQVFLMLFWSIYLSQGLKASPRLYGIETLQNKAIRYLFNLIHNSSSTLSP